MFVVSEDTDDGIDESIRRLMKPASERQRKCKEKERKALR